MLETYKTYPYLAKYREDIDGSNNLSDNITEHHILECELDTLYERYSKQYGTWRDFENLFEKWFYVLVYEEMKKPKDLSSFILSNPDLIDVTHYAVLAFFKYNTLRQLTKLEYNILKQLLTWEKYIYSISVGEWYDIIKEDEHLPWIHMTNQNGGDNTYRFTKSLYKPVGFYRGFRRGNIPEWRFQAAITFDKKFAKTKYCSCCGEQNQGFSAFMNFQNAMPNGNDYAKCPLICSTCSIRKKYGFADDIYDQIRFNFTNAYNTMKNICGARIAAIITPDVYFNIFDGNGWNLPQLIDCDFDYKKSRLNGEVKWNNYYAINRIPDNKQDLLRYDINIDSIKDYKVQKQIAAHIYNKDESANSKIETLTKRLAILEQKVESLIREGT